MAETPSGKKTAGAFDIRNVIGALIALYGLLLTLMGLFGDPETEKTGGSNANLWSGLVMLVVGILFIVWSRVRPVVVAAPPSTDSTDSSASSTGTEQR